MWGLSWSGEDSPFPGSCLEQVLTSCGILWMSESTASRSRALTVGTVPSGPAPAPAHHLTWHSTISFIFSLLQWRVCSAWSPKTLLINGHLIVFPIEIVNEVSNPPQASENGLGFMITTCSRAIYPHQSSDQTGNFLEPETLWRCGIFPHFVYNQV